MSKQRWDSFFPGFLHSRSNVSQSGEPGICHPYAQVPPSSLADLCHIISHHKNITFPTLLSQKMYAILVDVFLLDSYRQLGIDLDIKFW